MKTLFLALLLATTPALAQDNEVQLVETETAVQEELTPEPGLFLTSKTGCEPEFLHILSRCGMKLSPTSCYYEDREVYAATTCDANARIRREVCAADGVFDESKLSCDVHSRLRPALRRLR